MNTENRWFACTGIHARRILSASFALLAISPVLYTATRTASAEAEPKTFLLAAGAREANAVVEVKDPYVPWSNGDFLSKAIQIYRSLYGISARRNVAAFTLDMKDGKEIVIAAASAGNLVKKINRKAIFNVWINGEPAFPPAYGLNLFLDDRFRNGGNFDAEMLIARFIEARDILPAKIKSITIRTELLTCDLCASRIEATLGDDVPVTIEYSFPGALCRNYEDRRRKADAPEDAKGTAGSRAEADEKRNRQVDQTGQ